MKTITKGAMIASLAVLGLSLGACESKKEEATETQADAVQNAADATADAMDSMAASASGEAADKMNDAADAVRASGNTESEALREKADKQ